MLTEKQVNEIKERVNSCWINNVEKGVNALLVDREELISQLGYEKGQTLSLTVAIYNLEAEYDAVLKESRYGKVLVERGELQKRVKELEVEVRDAHKQRSEWYDKCNRVAVEASEKDRRQRELLTKALEAVKEGIVKTEDHYAVGECLCCGMIDGFNSVSHTPNCIIGNAIANIEEAVK